ncbi:MAG: hypothetical protein Q9195_006166 [Heterodermia aff. obscurata]
MGVGRRMKKQGPPPALDEFKVTKKRKSDIGSEPRGKKRKASGEVKPPTTSKPTNGVNSSGLREESTGMFKNAKITYQEQIRQAAAKPGARKRIVSLDYVPDDDRAEIIGSGTESPEEGYMSGALMDDIELDELPANGVPITEKARENPLENESSVKELPEDLSELSDSDADSDPSVYDSDDQQPKGMFSEDEDDSDAEEKLTAANIEGLSRKLAEQQDAEAANAQAELKDAALQTNIAGDGDLLSDSDPTKAPHLAPDLQLLRARLTETIRILSTPALLSSSPHSRSTLLSRLTSDICAYYGYTPFLATKLLKLFPPAEAFAFFEANETPRPLVIRTNTLRTSRRDLATALINRGVVLEPVGKWSKTGLQIFESAVPLGATPEYLAGKYILQAASSFLPVMALAPQEHERILDMAAAPGGKTTYISALMKNTGCIFANDANKSRSKALIGNIHRLGARNTIVCSHDARHFPKVIGGFDRVLLDAPCSGTGVIAKDPSVKTNKTETDFLRLPHLQKQLLLAAIDSVEHKGGYVVYSTCSVTVEENESVVQYALSRRPNVKLVDTGLSFGVEGFRAYEGKMFDEDMKLTRRYYPHKYNLDGFFVSKFRKTGPSPAGRGDALSSIANGNPKDVHGDGDDVDATPTQEEEEEATPFGPFDSSEDERWMQRARRTRLKKKGINPKAGRSRQQSQEVNVVTENGTVNGDAKHGPVNGERGTTNDAVDPE